eukprot:6680611-Prorocentrum_lima.AAC.1
MWTVPRDHRCRFTLKWNCPPMDTLAGYATAAWHNKHQRAPCCINWPWSATLSSGPSGCLEV